MKALFADTFYWIALTNPADQRYREALNLEIDSLSTSIITTDEVLSEFLTFFAADTWLRDRAAKTVRLLLHNPHISVLPQSRSTFLSGLTLYAARSDKGYSLTDCISMHAMRSEGITEVLTNDKHFEQEGFRALFRV